MKFKLAMLTLFVSMLAQAAPEIFAVKGQISSNDPQFDFTRLSVEHSIYCTRGWGDGIRRCGEKVDRAQVDSRGRFALKGLKGDNSNWGASYYRIYFDGQILAQNPYVLRSSEHARLMQTLLSQFTVYFLNIPQLQITTDVGLDLETWIQTINKKPISYAVYLKPNPGTADPIHQIAPDSYFTIPVDKNSLAINQQIYILPGELSKMTKKYSAQLIVRSLLFGGTKSFDLINQNISLADPLLSSRLQNLFLPTKLINRHLSGLWNLRPSISFQDARFQGGHFLYHDPTLLLTVKCEGEKLSGTALVDYNYSDLPDYRESIEGTCSSGLARFRMKVKALENMFTNRPEQYDLDGEFIISDISHDYADVDIMDFARKEVLHSYSGVSRCKKFVPKGKGYICERESISK